MTGHGLPFDADDRAVPLFDGLDTGPVGRLLPKRAKRGSMGCIGDTNPEQFLHYTTRSISGGVVDREHPAVHAVEWRRNKVQSET